MVVSLWPISVSLKFLFLDDVLHFLSFDPHLLADNTKMSCFNSLLSSHPTWYQEFAWSVIPNPWYLMRHPSSKTHVTLQFAAVPWPQWLGFEHWQHHSSLGPCFQICTLNFHLLAIRLPACIQLVRQDGILHLLSPLSYTALILYLKQYKAANKQKNLRDSSAYRINFIFLRMTLPQSASKLPYQTYSLFHLSPPTPTPPSNND